MIPSEIEKKIGKNISELIDDGSCLQLGIGALPDALAFFLRDRKDLGIHTEMFSAGVLELMKMGVVTGANKKIDRGRVVASFLLGTKDFYDYIDFNRNVLMMDIGYVNDPFIIARHPKVVAVNSAVQIDITGQISADSVGHALFPVQEVNWILLKELLCQKVENQSQHSRPGLRMARVKLFQSLMKVQVSLLQGQTLIG